MVKYIAVAGNMGSGKSSLVRFLCRRYPHIRPFYERNEENPYLADFYKDMGRWAFHSQVYFLTLKFRTHQELDACPHTVIQDRTIYEDAEIFAPNLHAMGLMSTRDFSNYKTLFDLMVGLIQPPDLLIYLKASIPTLVNQIQKRGREYENSIRLDYLRQLNERYEAWIKGYNLGKLLIVNVDETDFASRKEDLSSVIDKVNANIHGLF